MARRAQLAAGSGRRLAQSDEDAADFNGTAGFSLSSSPPAKGAHLCSGYFRQINFLNSITLLTGLRRARARAPRRTRLRTRMRLRPRPCARGMPPNPARRVAAATAYCATDAAPAAHVHAPAAPVIVPPGVRLENRAPGACAAAAA